MSSLRLNLVRRNCFYDARTECIRKLEQNLQEVKGDAGERG